MAVNPIPNGYHTVTPYLIVEKAEIVIQFLIKAFNAEQITLMKKPDGRVANAEIKIGNSMLMVADALGDYPAMPAYFYLYVPDTDKTYNQAISAGATSIMEPANQFYGDRNAGVQDPYGNQWWIATHMEDVTEEEMYKRQAGLKK